jgi:preprotein translocase subunit SecA
MRIPSNVSSQRREWPLRCFASEEAKWEAVAEAVEAVHTTGRPILVGTRNVGASERLAERLLHRGLACQVLNASRLAEEALVIAKAGEKGRITIATNMAGRGTDIVPDPEVVPLGGLHVIVTEPHESQRIDRQLYGRAGRQGDPGTSQLFASAEDEVIRKYGAPWRRLGVSLTTLRWAQRRAEREAAKKRQQVQRMDDWLDRALTFGA